jgi:nuclease HARBI1
MSQQQALLKFRFKKAHITRLAGMIPYAVDGEGYVSTHRRRYKVHIVEATCIILRSLATPCRWADLTVEFGRHPSNLSEVFYCALDAFYEEFKVLTERWPVEFVRDRSPMYATAIGNRGAALPRTIGFIDGTSFTIARPSGIRQRAIYSGHKRKNCLKFQAIAASDGLLLNLFGPMEGRGHDMTLSSTSGIDNILAGSLVVHEKQHYIYGDSAYTLRPYLQIAFRGGEMSLEQEQFNVSMSSVRIAIEWMFKDIKQYFTHVAFSRKLRLKENAPGKWYHVASILWNFRTCLYGCPTSTYFDSDPPTLEDYLRLCSGPQ